MWTLLLTTLALARSGPDAVDFSVDHDMVRSFSDPIEIVEGELQITLNRGWLLPVFSGAAPVDAWSHDRIIGFAWTEATGELALEFQHPGEAQRLANRMVRDLDGDIERFQPVSTREAPYETTVDRGYYLTSTVSLLEQLFPASEPLARDEVLVVANRKEAKAAARKMEQMLARRVPVWSATTPSHSITAALAWERHRYDRFQLPPRVSALEVRTADRLGLVVSPATPSTSDDRWLAMIHDESRHYLGGASRWYGALAEGFAMIAVHEQPGGPPEDEHPHQTVDLWVQPDPSGSGVRVDQRVRLQWTHQGPPMAAITLRLDPRAEDTTVTRVEMAGETSPHPDDLRWLEEIGAWTPQELEHDDPGREVLFTTLSLMEDGQHLQLLPREAIQAGDPVDVEVWTTSRWPLGRTNCEPYRLIGAFNDATQPHDLRMRRSWGGLSYKSTVRVPTDGTLSIVPPGQQSAHGVADDWRWIRSESVAPTQHAPWFMAGRWTEHVWNGPSPTIATYLSGMTAPQSQGLTEEALYILNVYAGLMPRFAGRQLRVVEGPPSCTRSRWTTGDGVISIGGELPRSRDALGAARSPRWSFAHQLAQQTWGSRVQADNYRDQWLVDSVAWSYACAATSTEDADTLTCGNMLDPDAFASPPYRYRTWSLSTPWRAGYQALLARTYGAYVLHRMLRPRIGDEAYWKALDALQLRADSTPINTEQFREALTLTSGTDLTDFFEYWVDSGLLPDIAVRYTTRADGAVQGIIRTDVPFGTFDVMLRLDSTTEEGISRDLWVEVVDGQATFEGPPGDWKVVLDPQGYTLSRRRSVQEVAPRDW